MKKSPSTQRGAVLFGVVLLACLMGANAWTWRQKSQEEKRELRIEVLPEEILEVTAPDWETLSTTEEPTTEPGPSEDEPVPASQAAEDNGAASDD